MDDSNEMKESSPFRRRSVVRFLTPLDDTDSDQQQIAPLNYNYGAVDDLGGILEDEELHLPLTRTKYPGGDDEESGTSDDSDNDEDNSLLSDLTNGSFHLGGLSKKMSVRNIMVNERMTSSFLAHGDDYELVPTQLKNNVRMVEDLNLIDNGKGRLYMSQYSYFNNGNDLKFALTVRPDIYRRVMNEVNDAFTVPCGLYFCCHGGDAAHTGVSHNDYVDIKMAWFIFAVVIGLLMAVDLLV